jgi:hypothetical protein
MNKVQVRLVDSSYGKIITKTFEGEQSLVQAIAYLQRLQAA